MVFVSDLKTPEFVLPAVHCHLSVDIQRKWRASLAQDIPWGHYARKNLGYVQAMHAGAIAIFDTDDDNAPIEPWAPKPAACETVTSRGNMKWVNAYAHFGGDRVWPRGYPLEQIGACRPPLTEASEAARVVVWQGLVAGDPDVDAIFRLTRADPVIFQPSAALVLPPGSYCPFNSQNTWWDRAAFPYLYLPSTVTFRFTDILRGLVAQRCFWAHGWQIGFHGPTARQERNDHDLLADFRDELPCYLITARIVALLDSLVLGASPAANLRQCYAALAESGCVQLGELRILESWLSAVANSTETAARVA